MWTVSSGACSVCRRAAAVKLLLFRAMSAAANPQPQPDFLKGRIHRKHPGVTNLKTQRLPEELQMAARSIILNSEVSRLPDRADRLTNFLWSRKRAIENSALRKKAKGLEKELWEKAMGKRDDLDEEALADRIRSKVMSELRRTTYHWTQMKYDEEMGVVYIAARLAGVYAAVRRALNEIKMRDPAFAPKTLLDFGSGLGSVAWASHSFWGDTLKEMVCVDSSGPMNILAERLLKGDDEKGEPHFKHVYFRQFLPVSPKVQFDLVTAAYTLSELQNVKDREETVMTLWRKTSSYLVLVENGTKDGHQLLLDARDTLLKTKDKIVHDPRPASVFAPCPHEQACPKLSLKYATPCNFLQSYQPLPLPGFQHHNQHKERFSYMIFSRTGPAKSETEGVDWARLTAPVQRRVRHVHCRMCCSDGSLQHLVVTARRHSRDVYRCARSSDWGDLFPVIQTFEEEDDIQTDSEES